MLRPMSQEKPVVFTVSELNAQIKHMLESGYPLVWVMGEISNFRVPSSGHHYFTLKDDQSQIRAVFFRPQQRNLRFTPEAGLQVLCQGRLSVYEPRGEYQLIVEMMEPQGFGALQLAFEQLKKKLEKEGLFDSSRKQPLPTCPTHIAIVTSSTGAAIQDILRVFQRSPYALTVTILPVRVQGREAAAEIAAAIGKANQLAAAYQWDLLIVGRGGGSIEDLWPFNEEVVARALADSTLPTLSAVGHEIDFTISDMVADQRAPTPTAAAEWVVTRLDRFERELKICEEKLVSLLRHKLDSQKQMLQFTQSRLVDPRRRLADLRLFLDERMERMLLALEGRMERARTRLLHYEDRMKRAHPFQTITSLRAHLDQKCREMTIHQRKLLDSHRMRLQEYTAKLNALSPLSVLERGYSITYGLPRKEVLRDAGEVQEGDKVLVQLARGNLVCEVRKVED